MSGDLVNWTIVVLYLGVTVWVGQRLGRGQAGVEDYFLAGRRMPWWAASLSIVGTETSTLTFVGVPAIAYGGDLTFIQVALGYVVGRTVVALLLVPAYFRGRLQTAYELLHQRFGGRVQTVSSLIFMGSRCLADGVRLFATALVLQALLSTSLIASILLVTGITLIYTLLGGLRAVIWNDVGQLLVYLGGAGVAAWVLLGEIPGGWGTARPMLEASGKLRWLDLGWDLAEPYTVWAGVLGGAVLTAATHGTDQMFVQRLLATGERRASQVALVASGVVVFLQMAFFLWVGGLLYVFYALHPPSTAFASNDQVFPRFIAEQLPVGVAGLVIAALFAAAMSTLSSSLSSLASSSTLDLWMRSSSRDRETESHEVGASDRGSDAAEGGAGRTGGLRTSRWMTVGWAGVLAGVAVLARAVESVLEVGLSITSVTFGGVLGIFLLALTPWRIDEGRAAFALGLGVSVTTVVAVGPSVPLLAPALDAAGLGTIAWTWYTSIGAAVTLAAGAALALSGHRGMRGPGR